MFSILSFLILSFLLSLAPAPKRQVQRAAAAAEKPRVVSSFTAEPARFVSVAEGGRRFRFI